MNGSVAQVIMSEMVTVFVHGVGWVELGGALVMVCVSLSGAGCSVGA
jgi:DNA relaxase NicK